MAEYDITAAFQVIENELMASMVRNMKRHRLEEIDEDKQWTMWQAEQLKALEKYKKENQKKYERQFQSINKEIETLIRQSRADGNMQQEIEILKAIKNGFTGANKVSKGMAAEFFKLNERKLEALIKATTQDMQRAEIAVLRKANDDYRKAIFNAQVYANTGAGTYEKAVDMATKDMLSRGLNCVEYANGARHTLADYADMAIRTASKRAYLQGEGEKRQEWGIHTVIVNKRGNPCPKCLPFCGKVLIDDVWSGGKKEEGPYPLMSYAVRCGLYHPRCKDSHTTYFPGISTADDTWTKEELEAVGLSANKEAKLQYAKRQEEKYGRLAKYSLDDGNKKQYRKKQAEWEEKVEKRYTVTDDIKEHRADTPQAMVELVDKYSKDEFVILDDTADGAFTYDQDRDAVVINTNHPQYPYCDQKEAMIHEIAHRIDQNEFGSPMDMQFSEAIIKTEKRLMGEKSKYKKMFEPGGKLEYNELISDILGCITDNAIVGGASHDSQYIGIPGYTELEVFANIFAALYQGSDETVKFIKEELQEIHSAFLRITGE
ncbi:MAG: minor capsid protein [Roseburia sp.]|nr:minor capsid protein [Roseburia sp.]